MVNHLLTALLSILRTPLATRKLSASLLTPLKLHLGILTIYYVAHSSLLRKYYNSLRSSFFATS